MSLKHISPEKLAAREARRLQDSTDRNAIARNRAERMAKARASGGHGPGSGHGGHRGHGGPGGRMMPGEKPRDFKGTMSKMLRFMAKFKLRLLIVFFFAIGSTVFNIVGPKVLSEATTALFNGTIAKIDGTGGIDFAFIGSILLATLALYLLSSLCSFVQSWTMSYISQKTCYDLRDAISKKIDRLPYSYFDKTSTGDVLSRITNDIDALGQSLNQGITQAITSTATVIGVLVMMLSINWVMTLIALLMVPLSVLLASVVVKRSQKYFYAQQSTLGDINTIVEETFSGHAIVKAFNRQDATIEHFNKTNEHLYDCGWKAQFLSGLIMPVMNFIGNLGYVAVAVSGAFFAAAGIITVGDIQAFIQYIKNFTQPITQLAQVSNVLQQMAAAAERIFAFLDEPEMDEETPKFCTTGAESSVVFEHVRFGYDPSQPIIKDMNAEISPGQTVAIVGPTGAGKTTIVKLLMRFYDIQAGSIKVGGHDIRDYSINDIRGLFAMVLQDTWLFSGTIRDNIAYAKLDATDEEVQAAAKDACVHHFISTLPGGYDFVIGEDATNISQGQRQLITIARALLADRKMLILDEATSSVDTRTEARIQQAMDNLMQGKTSFVIAHRLSTIRNADMILVMDHGDIVEQGTHNELLEKNGFYAELYRSQFAEGDDTLAMPKGQA